MMSPRLAIVTIGQTPRDDVIPEMLMLLEASAGRLQVQEFGVLDGLAESEIRAQVPRPREARLHTRLAGGTSVVLGSGFVVNRLEPLLQELDGRGYDLIVLASTSIFRSFRMRTSFVHAQSAVDAWIATLVMGDCELGLIHSLAGQHRGLAHGTLVQNARAVVGGGESAELAEAAERLKSADLILMHSVSYSEHDARHMAALTRKPVVTARRILAGAMRLHLAGLLDQPGPSSLGPAADSDLLAWLMDHLPGDAEPLTPRERDVLAAALEGGGNKEIGRKLGISHRTVEIHRGRGLAKLNARSPVELIRRLLITRGV
ncbi:AroM family protein [Muricoccus nepalensis]|nr:AroM family protein [Roseomonas nepalensis]